MKRQSEAERWADEQLALLAEAHGLTVASDAPARRKARAEARMDREALELINPRRRRK